MEWSAWWPIACGAAMMTVGCTILLWGWLFRSIAPVWVQGAALTIGGAFVVFSAAPAARRAADGGDIIWIIMPDALEIRTPLRSRRRPWSELHQVLYEAGWRPNSARLSVGGPTLDPKLDSWIWLNSKVCDTRGIQALLRERIAAAKVSDTAVTSSATINPPASHRTAPS